MKTVLITGATSGIGEATAELLSDRGFKLILCGRRREKLNKLDDRLGKHTPVHTLRFDVRDREEVEGKIRSLPEDFNKIDVLINNAGNAHGLDSIEEGSTDDWDAIMDINVKGLLYVSRAILPQMKKRGGGHVINIGSTAGKEVYPKGNVYCASKHAVDAINKGMRIDLNGSGIRVGAVNPGMVETNFSRVRFKDDDKRADRTYQGFKALQPEDVAEVIHFAITRPPHVNIADLTMMCTAQASSTIIDKKL